MARQSPPEDFKVIIAGAGIAGLTLANCLELAGIEYVLLEARDIIAPTIGAGVALGPLSLPVLEQIGLYDEFCKLISPATHFAMHDGKGNYIDGFPSDTAVLARTRFGYERGFLERGQVLKLLYENLTDKEQKVKRSKRISEVFHTAEGVTVRCTDGSTYTGDVIAGTDGIHSKVRSEMWRIANEEDPGAIPEDEQKPLKAVYTTFYGITKHVPSSEPGHLHLEFNKTSVLWSSGLDGRCFFGVWEKLDEPVDAGTVRYSDDDTKKYAQKIADLPLLPYGALKFGDLWEHTTHWALVPSEEGFYEHCVWGRFAMLGDSVHKVTPSSGQGANISITSAAALTNTLRALLDASGGKKPGYEGVKKALVEQYQNPRTEVIKAKVKQANIHTRVVTMDNFIIRFLVKYIIPRQGPDSGWNLIALMEIGSDILNFVPVPENALRGTMGFNKLLGHGVPAKSGMRWLRALVFIALFILAAGRMDLTDAIDHMMGILNNGVITWNSGSISVYDEFFHIKPLDNFLKLVTTFFSPWTLSYDKPGQWQSWMFLIEFGTVYTTMLFESNRRANIFTFVRLPWLFMLAAQYLGGGLVLQLYFFVHSIISPMEKYAAPDERLTDIQYTSTVLPAMILGFYIPTYLSLAVPTNIEPWTIGWFTVPAITLETRYWWSYAWQLFPIWVWAIQKILAWTLVSDTLHWDRLYAPKRDLPYIRFTIYTLATVSAATWWYTLSQYPSSLEDIFMPVWTPPKDFIAACANFMKWDYIFVFSGTFAWLALLFHDLKTWDMIGAGWVRLVLTAAVTVAAVGPGAAAGLAWLWREETIASKKLKGTLTKDGWMGIKGGEMKMREANGKIKGIANGHANGHAKRR